MYSCYRVGEAPQLTVGKRGGEEEEFIGTLWNQTNQTMEDAPPPASLHINNLQRYLVDARSVVE